MVTKKFILETSYEEFNNMIGVKLMNSLMNGVIDDTEFKILGRGLHQVFSDLYVKEVKAEQ